MKKVLLALAILLPGACYAQLADSAQRVVRLQGAVNFRDVGGYTTKDGKKVAWGKVFRSADVSHLTDQDLQTLEQKHIRTVIDFRGVKEAAMAPDRLPAGTGYELCPAGSDSLPSGAQIAAMIRQGNFMEKFYGDSKYLGARYRSLFQKLLTLPEKEALMYHCTGGRDRTGMATALFLYALGVAQQTIEADFTASNVYLQPMYGRMFKGMQLATGMDVDSISKALELKPVFLQSMFNAIIKDYGSVEAFFQKELGIGPEGLKTLKRKYTI
ncbi:MAG TPA: tyrosine-protein phosphatase [Chitinophaga sp.]|uniref:tyrosine-protein phosphatase n=1 Tax=Chitinophaga sp. TaxID=1869181 RepID=UPI002C4E5C93|nr:tyrosine-protein phosphatase [Chitinophaga sp.]HVI44055.1 tyrosine-protein phosphatase [Chitinophaga sp.]